MGNYRSTMLFLKKNTLQRKKGKVGGEPTDERDKRHISLL